MNITEYTVERLQSENRELRQELEKAQTTAHHAMREAGSLTHRGAFANCPDPDCAHARALLGKELPDERR